MEYEDLHYDARHIKDKALKEALEKLMDVHVAVWCELAHDMGGRGFPKDIKKELKAIRDLMLKHDIIFEGFDRGK